VGDSARGLGVAGCYLEPVLGFGKQKSLLQRRRHQVIYESRNPLQDEQRKRNAP
jgi:hypothetical protein